MDKLRIVIIGGGIAGLSAAFYLKEESRQRGLDLAITVVEAQLRWGGKIYTERRDGFLIEEGPDSFLSTKPWAVQLCKELGISDQLIPTSPVQQKTFILRRGELVPLPNGLTRMLPADLRALLSSPLFSWGGKLRMLLDFVLPSGPGRGEESLRHLITRRLGQEAYDRLLGPLMGGVYGGDGDRLNAKAVLPYLAELEAKYGSLLRGARILRKQDQANQPGQLLGTQTVFLTPRDGMSTLVNTLVARLEAMAVQLLAGQMPEAVSKEDTGYRLSFESQADLEADGVILAIPAYAAAGLLDRIDAELASELASIEFAPAVVVSLAYERKDIPHPLDAYGYLIPRSEGRAALACTWTSTKFVNRAPKDGALLRVFLNQLQEDGKKLYDKNHYVELARLELGDTLGVQAAPRISRVQGAPRAMPQYNQGHLERLQRIENRLLQLPGFTLAGNSYYGVGIPDTIHYSQQIAGRMLDSLQSEMMTGKHKEIVNEH